jgi:DMSO/TMAO reductase YedYZ molybdopterin-dependent catalytic subunit
MRRNLAILLLVVICCSWLAACGGNQSSTTTPTSSITATTAASGHPSTTFQLTGMVVHPGTFALADLQTLPKVTVTITTSPLGQHTFGGILLYSLLQQAGVITDSTRKNDILRKAVLVTGTDGYSAAIALGEIIPRFANKQVILAYEEDGKQLPQADGFVRLVVPGDAFAGRYVSNVAQVTVVSPGPVPTLRPGLPSNAFYLDGQVMQPAKYDMAALKAMTTTQVTVQGTSENGQANSITYSGVLLNDLLTKAGTILDKKKNGILRLGVVAVGSDGYSVLVAGGEIAPKFGNIQVLVAFSANGQPLSSDGFARLVVPQDQAMGRFVSNLIEIQVVSLTSS